MLLIFAKMIESTVCVCVCERALVSPADCLLQEMSCISPRNGLLAKPERQFYQWTAVVVSRKRCADELTNWKVIN